MPDNGLTCAMRSRTDKPTAARAYRRAKTAPTQSPCASFLSASSAAALSISSSSGLPLPVSACWVACSSLASASVRPARCSCLSLMASSSSDIVRIRSFNFLISSRSWAILWRRFFAWKSSVFQSSKADRMEDATERRAKARPDRADRLARSVSVISSTVSPCAASVSVACAVACTSDGVACAVGSSACGCSAGCSLLPVACVVAVSSSSCLCG